MKNAPTLAITPSLENAINRHVLKVLPGDSIATAINKMSAFEVDQASALGTDAAPTLENGRRESCALVVENERVVGIITERDIVRITATQLESSQSLAGIPVSTIMSTSVKTMEASALHDIFAVLFLFRRYQIRHLPIVDSHNRPIGVVTAESIREVVRPANLLKLRRVADVMTSKVVRACVSTSVVTLAQMMTKVSVSCVVIVENAVPKEDEAEKDEAKEDEVTSKQPIGIVTERDIVRLQSLGLNLHKLTARDVMSAPLHILDPQDSLWAAHQAMQTRQVRRLVVSWNWGQELGLVTQTSLLRVFDPIEMYGIIDSLQETIRQLKSEVAERITPEEKAQSLAPKALQVSPHSAEQLMTQATGSLTASVEHCQLSNVQQEQLQQAIQLIEQARESLLAPIGVN